MILRKNNRTGRKGAAAVELALVSVLLFMTLFGIFEYCRLLYVTHVVSNAARDAARFAVVHTSGGTMAGEPLTITTADLEQVVRTGKLGPLDVAGGMSGMDSNLDGLTVEMFEVDPAGLRESPPVVRPLSNTTWRDAGFSQKIAIRVSGNYRPVLPSLLFMNASVPVQITVLCSSEAN